MSFSSGLLNRDYTRELESIYVLCVDDDPSLLELTATFLERESSQIAVHTASNVRDGLDHLAEHDVGCIISDYDMPELTGLDYLEAVRETHPDLPFILFTGKGSEEIASEAISAGVTDYLQKGGTEKYRILINRITNAVEQYRTTQALEESQRQLTTLVGNLPGVVYRATPEESWRMEVVSGRTEAVTGYSNADLEQDKITFDEDLILDADVDDVRDVGRSSLDTGEPFEVTYRIETRAGKIVHVWEQSTPIFEDGDPVALEGFIMDMSCPKEQEQRLNALHETARKLMRTDSKQEIATVASTAARDLLGLPVNTILLYDEEKDILVPVTETPEGKELFSDFPTFREGEGLIWESFDTGELRVFEDVSNKLTVYNPETPIRSELHGPLGKHGVFMAGSTSVGEFDEQIVSLARILAANTEAALDRLTDQQQLTTSERDLNRKVRQFDAVFNSPLLLMGILDPDGSLQRINQTALDSIDSSLEAVENEPFSETPWWTHSDALQTSLKEWIQRAATGETVRFESDHYDSNGEQIIVDGILQPVRSSEGEVEELVCAGRNITQLKQRERKIRELRHQIQDLIRAQTREEIAHIAVKTARDTLDLTLSGIHLVDGDRQQLVPTVVTDQLREKIGKAPIYHRSKGARSIDAIVWDVFESAKTAVLSDIHTYPEISSAETPARSGVIHPLDDHGVLITSSPEPAAIDETDQALLELLAANTTAAPDRVERELYLRGEKQSLESENQRLEEFTQIVSHDLRNPLTLAAGRLELFREDGENEHLDGIAHALERMDTLIESLLTLAHGGRTVDDFGPLALDELVRQCWTHFETTNAEICVDASATVRADESRLAQVFENLFRNAIEHGGEDVMITVGTLPDGFYVEDDGPGIPAVEREDVQSSAIPKYF